MTSARMSTARCFAAALVIAGAFASGARAQCNSGVGLADSATWTNIGGCWEQYFLWEYQAYRMFDGAWRSYGFRDACNLNLPYAKAWLGTTIVEYGLQDDINRQWHGSVDYQGAARAWSSRYHNQINYTANTERTAWARAFTRQLGEDWTQLDCPLFDYNPMDVDPNNPQGGDNPASRAAAMVHEGWHHWQVKYGYRTSHFTGTLCPAPPTECDWYYWHPLSAYDFGAMWENDGTWNRFHSPYQVQAEALCDIARLSSGWVPASVAQIARAEANARLTSNFRNPVGYTCGTPSPWSVNLSANAPASMAR